MKDFVKPCTPQLPVADLAATLRYYRDVLGISILWQWKDDFAAVGNGEVKIYFSLEKDPPSGFCCYLLVDDAEEVYHFCKKNGATIAEELESRPWGMREFRIRDLNGHILRIGHGEKKLKDIDQFRGPGR